ncbi:hypothetical protein DNHGIG_14890 [Collibacillus ludicampi]|uniref:DNA adenine methylase n=1 Tax=Collibacillus ludicampi TaxID=2771369 RepID=A0AAV4LDN9_9BACL|nr:DNA adenine methylase [Collibacillus ludicampi]GIM45940.1 hypothetical protein DNHGIG_14890 [Collibacillus ludicampi]
MSHVRIRSPLLWYGGKCKLAQIIINLIPQHRCYVEPFAGGAHVLTQKPPAEFEVYNDIDGEVVNFLLELRKDPDRMAAALETLPYSRALYERWKWEEWPAEPFERAVRWFYINRSAVAAGNNHRSGWRHGNTRNPAKDFHTSISLLKAFAERFKYVQIECRDFREVIQVYDSPYTVF